MEKELRVLLGEIAFMSMNVGFLSQGHIIFDGLQANGGNLAPIAVGRAIGFLSDNNARDAFEILSPHAFVEDKPTYTDVLFARSAAYLDEEKKLFKKALLFIAQDEKLNEMVKDLHHRIEED